MAGTPIRKLPSPQLPVKRALVRKYCMQKAGDGVQEVSNKVHKLVMQ